MKLLAIFAFMFILAGCGKSDDTSSSSSSEDGGGGGSNASANPADPQKPWEDPAKPYLTEKKMGDFVASLKDPKTPFDAFAKGLTAFNAEGRMAEFEASAKRHGFESADEYMGAWMRIMGASTQVQMDESIEGIVKGQEDALKTAEEALKKPDLTPEMKELYQNQAQGARQAIEAYKQPRDGGVNAQDIATFKKHRAEFEAAFKERIEKK